MNRKPLIIAISFAIILLGAIIVLFFTLFKGDRIEGKRIDPDSCKSFNAVPSDAVAVIRFDSFRVLDDLISGENAGLSSIFNKSSSLLMFTGALKEIYSERFSVQRGEEALLSMHYSDKDEISLLFVQPVQKIGDQDAFFKDLSSKFSISGEKSYGSAIIANCSRMGIFLSLYRGFLVISTSQILVESSLRHLDNAISIVDNKEFMNLLGKISGDLSLMVNYRQIGKFFSGTVNRPYLKYADFASKYTAWSISNYKLSSDGLAGAGTLMSIKKEENYSSIFAGKKPKESQIYKVAPFSANFVFSMNMSSPKEFRRDYMTYLEINKKRKDYDYILASMRPKEGDKLSPAAWFESMNIDEVGVISLPVGEGDERVILIHDNKKGASTVVGDIVPFEYKGYLSALIGSWFSATSEEFCLSLSDWLIIGSEEGLTYFADMYADGSFTMYNYLDQLSLYNNILKNENHISFVINLNNSASILEKIFRRELIVYPLRGLAANNVSFGLYGMTSEKRDMIYSTALKIESVERLPHPKYFTKEGELLSSVPITAAVIVPEGPFEVRNFVTGKPNYFEQQANNMIRLLDENKRGVWTIPFDWPICGYVEQVDHYKNGKLQMLFGASDKIYLLDRLGRFVSSYPISVGKNIVLGPKVWDFNGNREYSLMILHDDNTIGLYNIRGEKIPGWKDIAVKEQIISLPERLQVGDSYYWVLRTPVQTLIFDSLGSIVADFSRRNIITPDTEIEILSSTELRLTTIDDKQVTLNLEKGSFKR